MCYLNLHEDSGYYLSAFGDAGTGEQAEEPNKIKKQRSFNKKGSFAFRLGTGLAVSLLLGLFTVGEIMSGNNTQAWFNLVSRITTLFTAFVSGYISGVYDVKLQARDLMHKVKVLRLFKMCYEKHLFPTYDEDEQAKVEYEEYEKARDQAVELVVDPEESDVLLIDRKDEENKSL